MGLLKHVARMKAAIVARQHQTPLPLRNGVADRIEGYGLPHARRERNQRLSLFRLLTHQGSVEEHDRFALGSAEDRHLNPPRLGSADWTTLLINAGRKLDLVRYIPSELLCEGRQFFPERKRHPEKISRPLIIDQQVIETDEMGHTHMCPAHHVVNNAIGVEAELFV